MATYSPKALVRDFTDTTDASTGYLMGHSQQEAKRLDAQHVFLRHAIDDRLISPHLEPAVRTGEMRKVLDVATGTGIWCAEVVEELRPMGVTQLVSVLGVDIAENEHWSRYCSARNDSRISFEKADMHDDKAMTALIDKHGTFDLVNIRWVAVAVKKDQWPALIERLFKLVRPGGYIQMMEVDVLKTHRGGLPIDQTGLEMFIATLTMFQSLGVDVNAAGSLGQYILDAGFQNVRDTAFAVHPLLREKDQTVKGNPINRDWHIHAPHLIKPHFLNVRDGPDYGRLLEEVLPAVTKEAWPEWNLLLENEEEYNQFLVRWKESVQSDLRVATWLHVLTAERP